MVLNDTRTNADKTQTHADKARIVEEPRIIYEDENFVAVDKPAGMLTHPYKVSGQWSAVSGEEVLTNWLLEKYPEMKNVGDPSTGSGQVNLRPGIVHRLDRETSGILLAARNQNYFEYLKSLFKTRQIKKTYVALVSGAFKEKIGVIDTAIRIKSGTVKRTVFSGKMAKQATTRYIVKKTLTTGGGEIFSLLEVVPETGRTHQIRVHLASIGHPIVGDRLYGPKNQPAWAERLMLHARSLEFSTAEGRRIKIEAEPPPEFVCQ